MFADVPIQNWRWSRENRCLSKYRLTSSAKRTIVTSISMIRGHHWKCSMGLDDGAANEWTARMMRASSEASTVRAANPSVQNRRSSMNTVRCWRYPRSNAPNSVNSESTCSPNKATPPEVNANWRARSCGTVFRFAASVHTRGMSCSESDSRLTHSQVKQQPRRNHGASERRGIPVKNATNESQEARHDVVVRKRSGCRNRIAKCSIGRHPRRATLDPRTCVRQIEKKGEARLPDS